MTGIHEAGKSTDNVTVFWNNGIITDFFPRNIKKFFKNVQKILFIDADLSALTKFDLQPFGDQLTAIWLHRNNIEIIEGDLFEFTPNIEWIQLSNNKIKVVGLGAFSNLKKLTRLQFTGNFCHSGSTVTDHSALIILVSTIERKCIDLRSTTTTTEVPTTTTTEKDLTEEIAKLKNDHKKTIDELNAETEIKNAQLEKLQLEVKNLRQEIELSESLKQKIHNLEIKIDAKMDVKFESIEAKLNVIESKLDTTKPQFETCSEHFTSINSTCSALDHKIDILNKNCVSKLSGRTP